MVTKWLKVSKHVTILDGLYYPDITMWVNSTMWIYVDYIEYYMDSYTVLHGLEQYYVD